MSKKTKTKSDVMLEEPAGDAVPGNTVDVPKIDWPASTANRELGVELTDEEAHEEALKLIREMRHAESLRQQKKAAAKDYDARIEGVEKAIEDLSGIVQTKQLRREVPCHWVFESHGINEDGTPKFHSGMKTLVRDDTGEAVEVTPITQDDRQMILPIGDEEAYQLNMKAIEAAGYRLGEMPDNDETDAAFALTTPDGEDLPIHADSLMDAAAHAITLLPAPAEAA